MVYAEPGVDYFKPRGVPIKEIEEVVISLEEFEAIRLKDLNELEQTEVAKKMKISQPTLHRMLSSVRKKISDAIINGKAIKIHGGNYYIKNKKR